MKADTVDLATIFGKAVHYVVPLYQRPYVWTRETQWEPLWEDIVQVVERQLDDTPANDAIPHFLGAVVLEQALVPSGMIESRTVIDGQQRLTTLQLVISAARSLAVERGLDDARQMFEKLLFNESFLVKRAGDELKVVPTSRDRVPFRESMGDSVVASTGGHRINEAYRFFRNAIREWAEDGGDEEEYGRRLDALSTAIWKRLVLVTIDLDSGDNAQVIFETLNARGTPLLAADLIKNHLFQVATVQGADIDALYEQYWQPLDTDWWRQDVVQGRLKRPRLDIFVNHWLAMTTGDEVVSHQLFSVFKRYLASGNKKAAEVLADLAQYRAVYERFEQEPRTTRLGQFLYRLSVLDVTTAYPPLLWLLGPEGLTESEQAPALAAIESWLVRRMLTRQQTKAYNVVFLTLLRNVRRAAQHRGNGPLGSDVVDFLAGLGGETQLWPRAAAVRVALAELPMYLVLSQGRLRMVLEAIEQGMYTGLSEMVQLPPTLTIEHVLPQQWEQHWPLPEGADPIHARFERDEAKHRLGNLTLVTSKLNPKMSNGPWRLKREALQQHSLLLIAAAVRNADTWDERTIAERGAKLADVALAVWPRPNDEGQDSTIGAPAASATRTAGLPDPEDPVAFAEVLAIADEIGVGNEIRRIVRVSRAIGLYPRADRYSVLVSSPSEKRQHLFSVKPQWDEGGSFTIWKSAKRFSEFVPGLSLEHAEAALGTSEDEGVLLAADVDAFLETVTRLTPAEWSADTFGDRRAELLALGVEDAERVPGAVLRVIAERAKDRPEMALRFAAAATSMDGVTLRGQESNRDPWYFQVRHPSVGAVVAYAHPFPKSVRVDYRLPPSHPTSERATTKNNTYGVSLVIDDEASLDIGLALLRDAVGIRPRADGGDA